MSDDQYIVMIEMTPRAQNKSLVREREKELTWPKTEQIFRISRVQSPDWVRFNLDERADRPEWHLGHWPRLEFWWIPGLRRWSSLWRVGEVGKCFLVCREQCGESWKSKCAKMPVKRLLELRPRNRQWNVINPPDHETRWLQANPCFSNGSWVMKNVKLFGWRIASNLGDKPPRSQNHKCKKESDM